MFKYVVRWLRNKNTTRYFEDHPAARDTIVTAVQEVTRLKPLPTLCNSNTPGEQAPALLPSQHIPQEEPSRDDQAPTLLASQHVAREGEGEFDYDSPADQRKNVSGGHHDESSPAAQQELEQGSRPSKYAYAEGIRPGPSGPAAEGANCPSAPTGNRPPSDYQMQLILLEHRNKKDY